MYEKGFGDGDNDFHVVVLRKMSPSRQIEYIKDLWKSNPIKYAEWVSLCVELEDLLDLFYVPNGLSLKLGEGFSYKGKESSNQKNKKVSLFLKKQDDETFNIVDQSMSTHVLEQIFDENGNIVQENLKLKI